MTPEEELEELLPCPFCGAGGFFWKISQSQWKISCEKDCITMPPRHDMGFTSQENAIKAWNERFCSACQRRQEEIERLQKALETTGIERDEVQGLILNLVEKLSLWKGIKRNGEKG